MTIEEEFKDLLKSKGSRFEVILDRQEVEEIVEALQEHRAIRLIKEREARDREAEIKARADQIKKSGPKTPIEELELSVRTYNCLRRAGYATIEELTGIKNKEQLAKIRSLGARSAEELTTAMRRLVDEDWLKEGKSETV